MNPMTKAPVKNQAKASPPSRAHQPLHLRHRLPELTKTVNKIRLCGSKYGGRALYFQ